MLPYSMRTDALKFAHQPQEVGPTIDHAVSPSIYLAVRALAVREVELRA